MRKQVIMGAALGLLWAQMGSAAERKDAPELKGQITLALDQARPFTLPSGAKVALVGNPTIADATQTPGLEQFTILTGKSYGTTHVVVLDELGRELSTATISVNRNNKDLITIHTGKGRASFSCAPTCAPVAALGDGSETFDPVASQIQQRAVSAGGQQ
ncbi:pilus assembly protein N-terminal domain-containing protein [Castellaniella sp.]|uniref:pilus assembly protein N-terminal domain-containing protein n=1 Tax=Castellaniella sp. TaxID=1955812 RepID=UPI002AFF1074|nr:pilus assembly protein N-terminal domain-containing protein [Castellaniella sp.]